MLLSVFCIIEHTAQPTAKPPAAGITDKWGSLIIGTKLLLIVRAALLASPAGRLALTFSPEADGTAIRDSGAGLMVDAVVAIGCGNQSSVGFNLSANSRTVFADVLCDLRHLDPLLEPRLDRQSVMSS